jgi:rod shape-determining protein MreC
MLTNELLLHRRDIITFLCGVLLSLILIFSNNNSQIQNIRGWAMNGFGFFLYKVSALKDYYQLHEKNRRLSEQNAHLMLENSRLREEAHENERLKKLLNFKSGSQFELVVGKIIGQDQNGFINSVILDVGHIDGIQKNMAVVTARGLAGKIFSVSGNHSIAHLLLDRNFRVGAIVQRTRTPGIIRWFHTGGELVLTEVPKRTDVVIGDTVVTSGISRIFPGGLTIGAIKSISDEKLGMFMSIVVEPAVDFPRIEEVFVVKTHNLDLN